MIVVERYEPKDERIGKFRCWGCKSVIQTEKEDIPNMTFHKTDYSDPRERDHWTFNCPICGSSVVAMYPIQD